MQYSQYQKAIFDWVKNGSGNAIVNAVAGSGKTSTGVDAMAYIDNFKQVMFAAFNRHIRDELQSKCSHMWNVKVATYNSIGWGACQKAVKQIELDEDKTTNILRTIIGQKEFKKYQRFKGPIKRLVSLMKGMCVFDEDTAIRVVDILSDHYDLTVPGDKDFEEILRIVYSKSMNTVAKMDFDDQVFMPLKHEWSMNQYDFIMVDEFQDTNLMQSELMKKALRAGGRMMVFGDPWQAIYGFRGATPNAMGEWANDYDARELPLSICYRCPRTVVEEAQKIVSHIEVAPNARDGRIDSIKESELLKVVQDRDYILCRTNAPLIETCLKLLKQGKKASVRGREVGDQLRNLVDIVLGDDNATIQEFEISLDEYYEIRYNALLVQQKERELQELQDKLDTLHVIMENCKCVGDIKKTIARIFDDNQSGGICLMTCHKSKGLQNPNVYVLKPEQLATNWNAKKPWMQEEQKRLKYVTITRSQYQLTWVIKA